MTEFILEALGVSKRFGPVAALEDVSLRLRESSFHALLGENGAGKSTLVKCIMGFYKPDQGEVLFGDKQEIINSPHEAKALGIGMVYQHFTLIPNMTVAENIVLSRPRLPTTIDWRREFQSLERQMQDMPFTVPLNKSVNRLSAGEKQKVEIIKQLMLDIRVLILDEPTSVLTINEADEVLGKIKQLTHVKKLSVLIITHKFREVLGFADEATVLRKGKFVGNVNVKQTSKQQLANMMVGDEVAIDAVERYRAEVDIKTPVLEINDLHVVDDEGVTAVDDLSLSLVAGEIVGIAGVSGNGQKQLVETLAGQRAQVSGQIRLHGKSYNASREQMRQHGFRCLPEEPLKNACVASMSVAENMVLREYDQAPFSWKNGILNRKAINANAKKLIAQFKVKTPDEKQEIGKLSGGNVQRAVLARELIGELSVLIVANPCFGLDFGAVAEIRERIMQARNNGAAVLLLSEDLDEILELSDRFFVIANGKLVHECLPSQANMNDIGQHMAGH